MQTGQSQPSSIGPCVDPVRRVVDPHGAVEIVARRRPACRPAVAKGVQPAVASIAGRQRAVEDRVAEREGADDVIRAADAERVLRGVAVGAPRRPSAALGEQRAVGRERPAAEAVAIEADLGQCVGALPPQGLDAAALHDGEDQRRVAPLRFRDLPIELVAAAPRPAHRALDRALLLRIPASSDIGAVVEADDDVADPSWSWSCTIALRRQVPLLAGARLAKDHLVVADDAAIPGPGG